MMISWLKKKLKDSVIFNYNLVNRDDWIKKQAIRIKPGSSVIDIGAGSCPYREYFSHCDYFTQDFTALSDDQLRHGRYGNIDYICDVIEVPVSDNSFDVILCTEVLEHTPEPIKVIKEFSRIIKPGGIIIITAPLGSGLHQEPYHYYGGYTPYWYEKFISEAGFEKIEIESNAGSLMFYSQESIRFIYTTRPFILKAPFYVNLFWAPIWLTLFPLLFIVIPVICKYIDKYDYEKRFTIGYHVTATKGCIKN